MYKNDYNYTSLPYFDMVCGLFIYYDHIVYMNIWWCRCEWWATMVLLMSW